MLIRHKSKPEDQEVATNEEEPIAKHIKETIDQNTENLKNVLTRSSSLDDLIDALVEMQHTIDFVSQVSDISNEELLVRKLNKAGTEGVYSKQFLLKDSGKKKTTKKKSKKKGKKKKQWKKKI